ncbi:hypothetical protein GCM10009863_22320 [Streptomyces axinellae]|uniref:Uncharacterized protein n=1 Tax=Streptomyces axinellae TaxID=552788 RepID=A0ABN3PZ18_9ACTN
MTVTMAVAEGGFAAARGAGPGPGPEVPSSHGDAGCGASGLPSVPAQRAVPAPRPRRAAHMPARVKVRVRVRGYGGYVRRIRSGRRGAGKIGAAGRRERPSC